MKPPQAAWKDKGLRRWTLALLSPLNELLCQLRGDRNCDEASPRLQTFRNWLVRVRLRREYRTTLPRRLGLAARRHLASQTTRGTRARSARLFYKHGPIRPRHESSSPDFVWAPRVARRPGR